ncbi:hypothetical protein [Okeania sp. SIO2B3]|uniref:hypothetical protein n=1 Tax=Okeania sp. SIO2B3 TaxID=2607784 RepID=UPI0025CDEB90|nr:hypothetical protein [Okeania sp. SIO2B3]
MKNVNIKECEYCIYNAWHDLIVCALHPKGPNDKNCPDFKTDPELEGKNFRDFLAVGEPVEINGSINNPYHPDPEENWSPPGTCYVNGELVFEDSYYDGERISQPHQRFTEEEKLYLLDTHPLFTGVCPRCNYVFTEQILSKNCTCPDCGWSDDDIQPGRM